MHVWDWALVGDVRREVVPVLDDAGGGWGGVQEDGPTEDRPEQSGAVRHSQLHEVSLRLLGLTMTRV